MRKSPVVCLHGMFLNVLHLRLAVRFLFETSGALGVHPALEVQPFTARAARNDYEVRLRLLRRHRTLRPFSARSPGHYATLSPIQKWLLYSHPSFPSCGQLLTIGIRKPRYFAKYAGS
jgi:hypothetical protein